MRRNSFALILLATATALALAPIPAAMAANAAAVVETDKLTWIPAPGLPPGALMAVLYGDPTKEGNFTVRFKFPAGYEVPTHSHPTDEFLTIISGKGRMAFGEDAAPGSAQKLVAGTFTSLPAGSWHRLWIDTAAVVELSSTGPFAVHLH